MRITSTDVRIDGRRPWPSTHKGYDAGKKVLWIKRPNAVDTQGLPHAITVTTADVNGSTWGFAYWERRWKSSNAVLRKLAVIPILILRTNTADVSF